MKVEIDKHLISFVIIGICLLQGKDILKHIWKKWFKDRERERERESKLQILITFVYYVKEVCYSHEKNQKWLNNFGKYFIVKSSESYL